MPGPLSRTSSSLGARLSNCSGQTCFLRSRFRPTAMPSPCRHHGEATLLTVSRVGGWFDCAPVVALGGGRLVGLAFAKGRDSLPLPPIIRGSLMARSENRALYAEVGRRLAIPLLVIGLAIAFLLTRGTTQVVVAVVGIVACVLQIVLAVRRRRTRAATQDAPERHP